MFSSIDNALVNPINLSLLDVLSQGADCGNRWEGHAHEKVGSLPARLARLTLVSTQYDGNGRAGKLDGNAHLVPATFNHFYTIPTLSRQDHLPTWRHLPHAHKKFHTTTGNWEDYHRRTTTASS
jgi:hypothetical protein